MHFIFSDRGIQLTPVNREPHGAGTRLENVANYLLYFQEVTHRLGGEEENSRVPLGWPPTSALPISQAVSASTRIQVESIEYPNWRKRAARCQRVAARHDKAARSFRHHSASIVSRPSSPPPTTRTADLFSKVCAFWSLHC